MSESCVLGTGRLSYPYLFEPRIDPKKANDRGSYNTDLLIAKDTVLVRPNHKDLPVAKQLDAVEAMMMEAAKSKWNGKVPAAVKKAITARNWLHDGDEKYEEDTDANWMYENCWIVRAKNWAKKNGKLPFAIVGKNPSSPITDEDEVYGGRYANLLISAWAYDKQKEYGSRGVSLVLNAVQVMTLEGQKGDAFGGGAHIPSCEDAFGAAEADDPSYYDEGDGMLD